MPHKILMSGTDSSAHALAPCSSLSSMSERASHATPLHVCSISVYFSDGSKFAASNITPTAKLCSDSGMLNKVFLHMLEQSTSQRLGPTFRQGLP